ncbi:hemolysin family protein [Georgenia sp. Z1344]|uniref:hemolysin family protein n=1 Tax=Georgenia sp. Z1344 TaxID=3416706 RepID=UPI003CE6C75D
MSIAVGVLVIVLITAATAYFVAQEFAYISVDRSRLAARAAAGDRTAARSLAITRRTSFMLSGAQLGITVTGLLVGYVAEPLVGQAFGEILGSAGLTTAVAVGIGAVLALVLSTYVQMLFGELFPKNVAIASPGPLADRLAPSTTWYLRLFGWLIRVFDAASNLLLRLLRIEPVHDVEHSASARDLRSIVAESREAATLSPSMSTLLDRVLDFPERDVEHAMIPRAQVDVVRETLTVAGLREVMAGGHTRYPVLAEDSEEVLGIVDLNDLLSTELPGDAPVTEIMREPFVVSHLSSLTTAMEDLGHGGRIACVVDEYGGFTGVLTLEDLAEELIGEIADEHDPAPQELAPGREPGEWEAPGDVHLDEIERALGLTLPDGDYETIAGLVIDVADGLPEVGQAVDVELPIDPGEFARSDDPEPGVLHAEVLEIDRWVPSRIRLTVTRPESDEPLLGDALRADDAEEQA